VRILVNLPDGFYRTASLEGRLARLAGLGEVRLRSCNTAEEIAPGLEWAEAVIMWSWPMLTPELLDRAPNLSFVGQIDITQKAARIALDRGLALSVSRGGFSPAVAEMALGLILSALRRIADHQSAMRAGTEYWVSDFPADIDPAERQLTGRAVGIVGFGGIGKRLAELLCPFRPILRVHDPYQSPEEAERYGATKADLADVIAKSEVVVICAASNPGTRGLLGPAEVEALRPGALLVNVARAALVDTDALLARLRRGDLYAALDVFDEEPLPAASPLRNLPNAWLTPHRAGGILVSVERNLDQLIHDLAAHIEGKPRPLRPHRGHAAGAGRVGAAALHRGIGMRRGRWTKVGPGPPFCWTAVSAVIPRARRLRHGVLPGCRRPQAGAPAPRVLQNSASQRAGGQMELVPMEVVRLAQEVVEDICHHELADLVGPAHVMTPDLLHERPTH